MITAIENSLSIADAGTLPNGVKVIEIDYNGTYQQFHDAPAAIKCNGVIYGKSSHNSDTNRIVYRSDKVFAVKV
jgi:hypothetical protein